VVDELLAALDAFEREGQYALLDFHARCVILAATLFDN
jgi:hypothetical protein